MLAFLRKWTKLEHSLANKHTRRTILGVEQLEEHIVPTVLLSNTYSLGAASVTETVIDNDPSHPGQYRFDFNVTNQSDSSGLTAFAVPVEATTLISASGGAPGWTSSVGVTASDLVAWQGPALGIGQSADLWYTTVPTGLGLTNGFATDGLGATPSGLLATAMNAAPGAPGAPPPALLVTTNLDTVNGVRFSLRDAVNYVNFINQNANQPVMRVAFSQNVAGATITLSSAAGFQQLDLKGNFFFDGADKNVTIQRDGASGVNYRLFTLNAGWYGSFANLTFRNGSLNGVDAGGAIRSYGTLIISGSTFSQNQTVGSHGGAISAESGTLNITGSGFTGNSAASGGAIYINERVSTRITSSDVVLNTATGNGGGIFIYSSTTAAQTSVILTSVHVTGNTSGGLGGGIYVNNVTGGSGTALILNGGTTVQNNQVNGGTGKGGGVYFGKGTLTLGGASIVGNTAAVGPSIYSVNGTTLTIVSGTTNTYADVTGP
ncbi:hypothetical protein [Frigoriglobus tundricola]|uniref:Right handed beta helix domain-containing protein n=1 Tax=Frigoriglobus tundricola TaxID=2774151 RepID=A0A6M5YLX9_9BACT|nr:hypothetical protein [Frigoriglobus tundricola]QJW94360.1 hypothetical protein FTUN_1880 [Frigoriglobus tundricola]